MAVHRRSTTQSSELTQEALQHHNSVHGDDPPPQLRDTNPNAKLLENHTVTKSSNRNNNDKKKNNNKFVGYSAAQNAASLEDENANDGMNTKLLQGTHRETQVVHANHAYNNNNNKSNAMNNENDHDINIKNKWCCQKCFCGKEKDKNDSRLVMKGIKLFVGIGGYPGSNLNKNSEYRCCFNMNYFCCCYGTIFECPPCFAYLYSILIILYCISSCILSYIYLHNQFCTILRIAFIIWYVESLVLFLFAYIALIPSFYPKNKDININNINNINNIGQYPNMPDDDNNTVIGIESNVASQILSSTSNIDNLVDTLSPNAKISPLKDNGHGYMHGEINPGININIEKERLSRSRNNRASTIKNRNNNNNDERNINTEKTKKTSKKKRTSNYKMTLNPQDFTQPNPADDHDTTTQLSHTSTVLSSKSGQSTSINLKRPRANSEAMKGARDLSGTGQQDFREWSHLSKISNAVKTGSTNIISSIYDEMDEFSDSKAKGYLLGQLQCELIIAIILTLIPWVSGIITNVFIVFDIDNSDGSNHNNDGDSGFNYKVVDRLSKEDYIGFSIDIFDFFRYVTLSVTVLLFRVKSLSFSYQLNRILDRYGMKNHPTFRRTLRPRWICQCSSLCCKEWCIYKLKLYMCCKKRLGNTINDLRMRSRQDTESDINAAAPNQRTEALKTARRGANDFRLNMITRQLHYFRWQVESKKLRLSTASRSRQSQFSDSFGKNSLANALQWKNSNIINTSLSSYITPFVCTIEYGIHKGQITAKNFLNDFNGMIERFQIMTRKLRIWIYAFFIFNLLSYFLLIVATIIVIFSNKNDDSSSGTIDNTNFTKYNYNVGGFEKCQIDKIYFLEYWTEFVFFILGWLLILQALCENHSILVKFANVFSKKVIIEKSSPIGNTNTNLNRKPTSQTNINVKIQNETKDICTFEKLMIENYFNVVKNDSPFKITGFTPGYSDLLKVILVIFVTITSEFVLAIKYIDDISI